MGGCGNDQLFGADGNDFLDGGEDNDFIEAGYGNDVSNGGDGNDVLRDDVGNDILNGGDGDDNLESNFGKNVLTGGPGFDQFAISQIVRGKGRPVIRDFEHGIDHVDLSHIDARLGGPDNRFKFIGAHDFHHRPGELHVMKVNRPGHAHDKIIIEGDTNGDGNADLQIELTGLMKLTKGDFFL